jgi:transposase
MSALLGLSGVGVPTASALLMFAFPDDYPILDVRALESLGVKPRTQYPIGFWLAYLECCRELANRHGVHIRTLDKALWQHSKERSAPARSLASGRRRRTGSSQSESAGLRDADHQTGFSQGDLYDRALVSDGEGGHVVIDRLREQIQERLDQLLAEADRLRKALAALDPRSPNAPARTPAQPTSPAAASAAKRGRAGRTAEPADRSPHRTAPGATKTAVLAALAGGEAMTAGEVATKAGLARATVSTTLSRLSRSGEVEKAERGHRLPSAATTWPSAQDG